MDNNNNHVILQRVVPVKSLKPGYHHLKLRNSQNVPLEMASLFMCAKLKQEHVQPLMPHTNSSMNFQQSAATLIGEEQAQMKHKLFKVIIYGLSGDNDEDSGTVIKVSQDTTVIQAIEQVRKLINEKNNKL
jgi:hypothetical protein